MCWQNRVWLLAMALLSYQHQSQDLNVADSLANGCPIECLWDGDEGAAETGY